MPFYWEIQGRRQKLFHSLNALIHGSQCPENDSMFWQPWMIVPQYVQGKENATNSTKHGKQTYELYDLANKHGKQTASSG